MKPREKTFFYIIGIIVRIFCIPLVPLVVVYDLISTQKLIETEKICKYIINN